MANGDTRRLRVKIEGDPGNNKTFADIEGELKGVQREAKKTKYEVSKAFDTAPVERQQRQIDTLSRKLEKMKALVARSINVDVDVDDSKLKRLERKIGSAMGDLGDSITKTLSSSGIYGAAAIVAAIAAAAPAAGAALSAAIPLAFGGGALAIGIAAAMKDPKVQKAFDPLKKLGSQVFADFGAEFKGPLISAAKTFTVALEAMRPTFTSIAKASAPIVDMLAPALASMAQNSLPGIKAMVDASVPLFKVLADKAPALGTAFSKFLDGISKGGPGAQKFLEDVFNFLIWVIPKVGTAIGWLSNRYVDWRNGVIKVVTGVQTAWNTFRGFFEGIGTRIGSLVGTLVVKFQTIKTKVDSVTSGMKSAFKSGVDSIEKTWNRLQDIAKKPVNFLISPVYANIRNLWNKVNNAFGLDKALPVIKQFSQGTNRVPGTGNRDTVPALLTPGEGILSKGEMRKIGGPAGFAAFRQSIAQFADGGIAGIKNQISKGLPDKGFSGLIRGGANRLLSMFQSADWTRLGAGLAGIVNGMMGYKRQQAVIAARFPGLQMISGYRPGAHTLSGNLSYHALGRAVDYPPSEALAKWIHDTFGRVTKELITPFQQYNLLNGRPHKYTGAVWNQHNFAGGNAHDHWAMDGVTTVNKGWFTGYNGTGKRETLVNSDLIKGGMTVNLYNPVFSGVQNIKQLRDEFLQLAKRNGGSSGVR